MSSLILDAKHQKTQQPQVEEIDLRSASEQTLLFSEQAARLLASIKQQYVDANALITEDDAQALEYHINQQIKGYKKLELYGGLKIVSAKIELVNGGVDLKMTLGVAEDMRLYKNTGAENEFYIGWMDGKDLYLSGGKLRVRSSNNFGNDKIVTMDVSQLPEAREARERSKWLYKA